MKLKHISNRQSGVDVGKLITCKEWVKPACKKENSTPEGPIIREEETKDKVNLNEKIIMGFRIKNKQTINLYYQCWKLKQW